MGDNNGLTARQARVIKRLCVNGWDKVRAHYGEDGICIATTRAALEVLGEINIEAQPLAVQAAIFTQPLAERVNAGTFDGTFRAGEHSVGIGYGAAGVRRWAGHLVVVTCGGLLDITLPQANRPARGLRVPHAGFFQLPPNWRQERQIVYGAYDNLVVVYELRHGDTSYESTRDWRARDKWQPAYAALRALVQGL